MFLNPPDTPNRLRLGGAHRIIECVFGFSILLDIISTLAALGTGRLIELNWGIHPTFNPVTLIAWSPWVWCIIMIGLLIGVVLAARALSKISYIPLGIGLMVIPIIIEMKVSINNVRCIIFL